MVKRNLIALLSCLALGGCGDDGGASADPDAAPDLVDAAPQNLCTVIEANYPDLGSVTGTASLKPVDEDMPNGLQVVTLQIPLNQESPPDVLFMELWQDGSPFSDGPAPYTINLIGDNSDLVTCNACTFIAADFTDPMMINFNMAYSGELAISSLDSTPGTGSVVGTLSNVKLHEVTISQSSGQVIVSDGCKSTLDSVAFSFDIAAP